MISSSYDANADDLFVRLGWQKLNLQRELKTATIVYKSLNGLALDYLKSMFTDQSAISVYSLWNCEGKLAIPLPRTNFLKNNFSYNGAVMWNSLPTNLWQAQTIASFFNLTAGVSFSIVNRLINHTAFMESRHFIIIFILLLLDLISSRLVS